MNAIYNTVTAFVMTPNVSIQTAMYSIPGVNLFVRQFQYYHCFEAIEKKGLLTATKFNEQQTKFQKGLKTGLQLQIAVAISAFALGLLFPVPSTAIWVCAHTSSVFFGGALTLYALNAVWKIPTFQRRTLSEGTVIMGG
jgi:hypothetical protein